MTETGRTAAWSIWGPMVSAGEAMLASYSEAELSAVLRYLREAAELQLQHVAKRSE
jgi:hypothetical protein